ncbi:ABC transporter permease [Pectinatus sottacetonis]|uniref:ABC transporter permease n=1 Tax=Pectinatus sottacetonis TaxID=1002795 RepID=UPI0018C5792E|nr:ABC transporter permease [Pectinatus sottacetonis]
MKIRKNFPLLILIAPITLWVILFIAIPMVYVFIVSLMTRGIYGGIEWTFTMHNYLLTTKTVYLQCFSVSFLMSAVVTIIALIISYPFAMFLVKKTSIYKIILIMLLMIPFLTNSLLRIYGWILILRTNGILNEFMEKIGLFSSAHGFLYTNPAIFIGLVYTLLPFMILPIYASLDKFDNSYLEASADLGAKPFQTFWRVLFPMTIPGVFAGSIMVFIPSFGLFFIMDLLGGNKIMYLGNLIRNQFLTARNWPFGAALSMLLVFLTLVLIYLYKRAGGKMNQLVD